MKDAKKRKKASKHPTKGQLNKLIDDLVHPFFKENESLIIVDGVLHGLVEQNPPLSFKKFIKYNLPLMMKSEKSQLKPQKRKRSYKCKIPVNGRFIICGYKKAGPWCLKTGILSKKCSKLVISYK